MVNIVIDNKPCEVPAGSTIYEAARSVGITIPTLCHMEGLTPTGACRICVVEVEGAPGLVPSCSFPVSEGMKITTHSPRVLLARKTIVELLLANHPDDCLYCIRNNDCRLQDLAADLGVRRRRYTGARNRFKVDVSSPSVIRDPEKCILCGKCVRVCEEVQQVSAIDFIGRGSSTHIGTAFDEGLNLSSCINCGQCILVCPTGALHEHDHLKEVVNALNDPERMVVVQHAPSVSVTIGEEFGLAPGTDCDGIMVAALRRLGFDRVFDTSFSADLTIMEEGSELVHRIQNGGKLPMLTSCSPGWIKFAEQYYPDFLDNISSCKSPQQMMGAIIKSYFAEKTGIDPDKIYSVSIMPCTAKKFEAGRKEMLHESYADVDAVLTTRELARLIRMRGLDMKALEPEGADTPFGERTTAGKIFGASGGVMEAALRSAYFLITGKNLDNLEVKAVRGLEGCKEAHVKIGELELGVAVASGLKNAAALLDQVRNGRSDLHFIEIMTCPGGCIAGGGQPLSTDLNAITQRMQSLYAIDAGETVRASHENESIKRLYEEYLGSPLSKKSHHLLHTHYSSREVML
ncbi:MAG: 4Fe-4S binding protein [Candidatus Hydrogenedentes bacterium]|nr:4Fe-4S binding protein [Candidatus Hydrogenedentota bacterium]